MFDEQFTPDEQTLIERLVNAPQPNLKPAAFDAIRQQVFDAFDAPPASPSLPSSPTSFSGIVPIVIVVIVAVVVVAIILIRNAQPQSAPETVPPAPIIAPTDTVVPYMTATPESTAETTPEITVQAEVTLEPLNTAIIIEGPVDSINANGITIYGINIELVPDDPILTVIQVGDVIRIEGNPKGGDTVIIVAVNVIFINVEVVVHDDQVWRDSGNCNNPPPPWAPANGWRRRCESSSGGGRAGEGSGS